MQVIMENDSDGSKTLFIVDEYYEMLNKVNLADELTDSLPGVLTIGKKH